MLIIASKYIVTFSLISLSQIGKFKNSLKKCCCLLANLLMLPHIMIFLFLLFANGASGATFTLVNKCNFTVWPGISGTPGFNSTGFKLMENSSLSFQVTNSWNGVIWGRTNCSFNQFDQGSCSTGDCGSGEMECYGRKSGQSVMVVSFSLNELNDEGKNRSVYDVIRNDFSNIGMTVDPSGGSGPCQSKGCDASASYVFDSCVKSSASNWCQHANYTVTFCPLTYDFSVMKLGRKLESTNQLVSEGGLFTLGFFGSDYEYLGIWYTGDYQSRKVWVANPNNPIISALGAPSLSINPNTGDLIITVKGRIVMNITHINVGTNPNVSADLQETGNFQLINNFDEKVLWQSFDNPVNVLLPGMKLGYVKTTGRRLNLTSWLSNEIPHSGAFTLSWEPADEASQRLMIRRRGQTYWASGNLENQRFPHLLALNSPFDYQLTSEYNKEEQYFSYNKHYSSHKDFPMWVLTPKGQITDSDNSDVWTPEFCYGYNSSNGCVESTLSQCRNLSDIFTKSIGDFAPDMTRRVTDNNSNLSIGDCFFKCWYDCNCVGFNTSTTLETGCVFWMGSNSYSVETNDNSTSKYVISSKHLTSPITREKLKNQSSHIWILVGLAIPVVFFTFGFLWYFKHKKHKREDEERRKRDEFFIELAASENFKDVHHLDTDGGKGNDLLIFSFASIMAATGDFSLENKLGQGGFGPVYKGTLSDGKEIAIKRLSKTSGQGLVEFKNELILIAKLQHTNLVRILGCCIHREEKMLIYEYMPNKSLDFFLFDENKKVELDWPKRFNIIEGIAQGLLYLHKYSRMRVIHRDLKANNILLDESMNPKIADFGMARMFKQNETEAMTNRVVGTIGYMPPEYVLEGTFSIKSDIFSFGVLILEIVSGRKNSPFVHLDRTINLIGYSWELWQQGNALELEDMTLRNTCVVHQFLRTVHVALLCVQESAMDRPTTSDMISMLLNEALPLPAPNKPAFFIDRVESRSTLEGSKMKHYSANMTITAMEGR